MSGSGGSLLFEVVTPAANAAARRLTTAAYVGATMSSPPADAILENYIDEVSAKVARFCGLAADTAMTPPTFASETLRATWFTACHDRGDKLLLPWRVPVSSITSIVEGGTTLTTSTEYRLLPGGMVLRLAGDSETPTCWSTAKIVVVYVAGWATLSTNAPADLQAAVAEQVKYRSMRIDHDPAIRSEAVPDVYSASYAVAGGDNIGESGLLVQVETALAPYRSFAL